MGFLTDSSDSNEEDLSLQPRNLEYPEIVNEKIPGALDLGWYYSEKKNELQMAKVAQQDRATHLYVVGATGTGKSKFLEFLIQQDIEKGNGFGVIDPHGDLVEEIKGFLAGRYYQSGETEEIEERVILVDPTDERAIAVFNPLEQLPGSTPAEQAAELVSVFKKIWSDSWGARMEDLMRNSLIALGEARFTLSQLPQFLTSRGFRQKVLESVSHPIAQEYFQRFDSLTDRSQLTWIEPVMNKINAFLSHERIRQMFSWPESSFNLREVMDEKKILLVKLEKGRLGSAADLLGSLLLAKIQMAAFSRSDLPASQRTPFYLYVDEFQNFATESFATILSEARKYGLSLVMAHQTFSQLPPELKGLILGNTGLQVYFRLNRQDAQAAAKEIFGYSGFEVKAIFRRRPLFWSFAEEWEQKIEWLQNLPPRACYCKHQIEGGVIPLYTVEIESPRQFLGMREREYQDWLQDVPFSRKYLIPREKFLALPSPGAREIAKEKTIPKTDESKIPERPTEKEFVRAEPIRVEPAPALSTPVRKVETPIAKRDTSQHKYLKALIKRVAESKGFRANPERSTPDGQGKVDVSLEREERKIACEVSWTSTPQQEMHNIEKCLQAGYDTVILCSPEKRTLEKVKAMVSEHLNQADQTRVLFFQPEELFAYLDKEAGSAPLNEERIKGYKVKVHYLPVEETERQAKREAIAKVLIQSLRHLQEKEEN